MLNREGGDIFLGVDDNGTIEDKLFTTVIPVGITTNLTHVKAQTKDGALNEAINKLGILGNVG